MVSFTEIKKQEGLGKAVSISLMFYRGFYKEKFFVAFCSFDLYS